MFSLRPSIGVSFKIRCEDAGLLTIEGLSFATDAFWRTTAGHPIRRTDYSKQYHTYGIEWSEDYIYTYLDSRLVQVLFTGFKTGTTLWDLGKFAGMVSSQNRPFTHTRKERAYKRFA